MESTVIVGRIFGKFPGKGSIIVAARAMDIEKEISHYTVLHDSGEYELLVGQGNYYVFAYWDKNSNLIYEAGEPAGQYDDPKGIHAPDVGVVFDINITIPEGGRQIEIPHGTQIASVTPRKLHSRQAGAIADLNDERFSEEYGTKGLWEPYTFFKEMGGNIYFLEEYDPEKIPILFIHGVADTPKCWQYLVSHIDRTRFQPWFFYYPTGARLDSISYLLYWKLTNLQSKYQFNTLYITAHSMGGLVARSFLINYGRLPYIRLFISLATPWGGVRFAEYGVEQSPVIIPNWLDMQPDGDFIQSLYRFKLPESVSFYMFYGHRGNRSPFSPNNDGTITLSSLLDYRPQSEAKMNYAFNEDHVSILNSEEVIAQYNTILNDFGEKQNAPLHRTGGHLRLRFSFNYDLDSVRAWPSLIISPVGKTNADTVISLSDTDNDKELGPFPHGDYVASMVISAGRTEKKYVPVSIESNETKPLDFVFTPDGEIQGCVTTSLKPEDKMAGMPDYVYRSTDKNINIQSITLTGNGAQRRLQQVKGEDVIDYDYLINREDLCYNNCFGIFGLSAGDYTLTIKAQGYKPIIKHYDVIPGIMNYFRVTELIPE